MSDPYENLQRLQQELERLRNENAALRRELYPPESPKKELKYWIVTWVASDNITTLVNAIAHKNWSSIVAKQEELKQTPFVSHINILEQRVLL